MRRMQRRSRALAATTVLAVAAVAVGWLLLWRQSNPRAGDPPSIVLILTDDQRWDTLGPMPTVRRELAGRGVSFTNGFVVNSVCCPSRASVLTGRYSHSTDVYKNNPPHGGMQSFDDSSTVATWLHDAGYRTALIGKYLNGYGTVADDGYVPPGWDRWVGMVRTRYYHWSASIDGELRWYGDRPEDYSTTVLAGFAERFIRRTDGPLFLHYSPWAPHVVGEPAPGDEELFEGLDPWRPPSYGEIDVSDKPEWVRRIPPMDAEQRSFVDDRRRGQLETLPATDRAVAAILDALADTGRLANTLVVFTSDNGFTWGEHRWWNKQTAYEESIRVPFAVRWDEAIRVPREDDHLVLNIDLAPTFADAAGVDAPEVDGVSLLPLLASPTSGWRDDFLIEHLVGDFPQVPTYCAVRDRRYLYVWYATDEQELYDLEKDPHQLENVASLPGSRPTVLSLRQRLRDLCRPPPPDLVVPSP
jgi:N-acetylglucosamine-6-sulfatase